MVIYSRYGRQSVWKIHIDMSWVKSLPTKLEVKLSDDNVQGVKKLFDENQPATSDNSQKNIQSRPHDELVKDTENLHSVSTPNEYGPITYKV